MKWVLLSILRSAVFSWVRIKYCWVRIFLNQYLLVAGMQPLVKRAPPWRACSPWVPRSQKRVRIVVVGQSWCPCSWSRHLRHLVSLVFQCYLFGLCSCAMCFFPFLHFFCGWYKSKWQIHMWKLASCDIYLFFSLLGVFILLLRIALHDCGRLIVRIW
jgi:hypothetical protein